MPSKGAYGLTILNGRVFVVLRFPTRMRTVLYVSAVRESVGGRSDEIYVSESDCDHATKGIRWMFWRQEAMKDVAWLR